MSVPICTIISWYGDPLQSPLNFEFCDGAIVDIVNFPALYGYLVAANPALYVSPTQARKPNLQGLFLRGFDLGGLVDPNHAIGHFQEDSVGPHAHNLKENNCLASGGNYTSPFGHAVPNPNTTDANGPNIGRETRPKNVAVSFLIKSTKDGEERSLAEIVSKLPSHYPDHIRKVLKGLAVKVDKSK